MQYESKVEIEPLIHNDIQRIDDIEIIDNPIKKEKSPNNELEDYMKDVIKVTVRSNIDDIRRVCFIKKDLS